MRKQIALFACKATRIVGKWIGKGSSMPGRIALKIDPNILSKIKMPPYIVAVTGSNGKTSTVEMIASILKSANKKFSYNSEGSNQIEGVTTFILNDCTLSGKVKSEILLIESDERFARHTFRYFSPTHYVITNLYRDQLTRNGHPEWVFNSIKESIPSDATLILNADDPLVSCFSVDHEKVLWFGANKLSISTETCTSIYNDGKYCPHCKALMEYEYYHYNHIGCYKCSACGLNRHDTQFTVTDADLQNGSATISADGQETKVSLAFSSIYSVYNTLAAFSVSSILGIDLKITEKSINHYISQNGRVQTFTLGSHHGTLLTSKHENSISYDQSLRVVASSDADCVVLIIVDAISRKYFTSETSWLFDIDFELLHCDTVKKIVLSGRYAYDLAVRFEYCGVASDRIAVIPTIKEAVVSIKEQPIDRIYTITCFSDKSKFLSLVQTDRLPSAAEKEKTACK